jgi:hypothetical protein
VCTPTDKSAVLNVGDLQTMLAGSDVTVKTGAGAVAIGVTSPLTWTSTHRLTLDSVQFVHIKAPVVVEGTAGLTLTTNDGGSGGDLVFENGGTVNFWDLASSLIVNGQSYKLVGDIKTLASGIAKKPSDNFALAGNFDASVDGTYINSPIPTTFAGKFEGLGHTVSNLTIGGRLRRGRMRLAGLFADLTGTVRDIALVDANISVINNGIYALAGALAVYNEGSIIRASASGTISNPYFEAGGLVDLNLGSIIQSTANVTVKSAKVGGLVEDNRSSGTISWSSALGSVTGVGGGLANTNEGTIANSFATGAVYGGADNSSLCGGLVGTNTGSISQSHATGDVFSAVAGGLTGVNGGMISQSYATGAAIASGPYAYAGGLTGSNGGKITQSYATGEAETYGDVDNYVGGLAGNSGNDRVISQSYSTGEVRSNPTDSIGGFLGHDGARNGQDSSYWDLDTSGITNPSQGAGRPPNDPGITGLTDAQLKSALPAGFDPIVWGQNPNINNGWPYLLANPPEQAAAKKRTRK